MSLFTFIEEVFECVALTALFLLDIGSKLYLWQAWWPQSHEQKDTNTVTGSGLIRWHAERRAAMQTAVDYRRLTREGSAELPSAELVWAGSESLEFTNLFPSWTHRRDVAELNKQVQ
jgi:supervillin